ncbi:hypothetical protein K7I13_07775 [Brucepastera parasyntrophica]|uniref:hypothetical protein n=1 Tax=Brucepastera parasyntrophica TaxID=2880008 RepID=UPI00210A5CDE|nr:hypothetical protein [Brucepastera parasyntrophica]ULQ58475.1 hypothetical protein K7I13_07775 [Brucepastera parasyntrophica]
MSSGKEIFKALNKQLKFAPEGMNKKATYRVLIPGQVWLYFGLADKSGGPYLGFWVKEIPKDLEKTLVKTLAACTDGIASSDVVVDMSWIYVSVEEGSVSADAILQVMKELESSMEANPDYAEEVSPAAGGKSVFSRIFFWFKTVVILAVLVFLFAAFFPEFTIRNIELEEMLQDPEISQMYEEILEAHRAKYGAGRLLSDEASEGIYNLRWLTYEKKHPVMGTIVNYPPINRFIRTINEGFRFVVLIVSVFIGISLVFSSGLGDAWAKQRKVVGKQYHSNGRVDDIHE